MVADSGSGCLDTSVTCVKILDSDSAEKPAGTVSSIVVPDLDLEEAAKTIGHTVNR